MLLDSQVTYYKTFGFVIIRQVLSIKEIAHCANELDLALATDYAHKPFNGSIKQVTSTMGPDTPFMTSLLEDPRRRHGHENMRWGWRRSRKTTIDPASCGTIQNGLKIDKAVPSANAGSIA